jgi:hypothetical protein
VGKYSAFNITGVLATLLWIQSAAAADLILSPEPYAEQDIDLVLPAVSGPNGKWELYLGPTNPGPMSFRAAGSLSLPVGDRFGVQLDAAASGSSAGWLAGGVIHGFTRDPDNYLIGLATGVVRGPTGTLGVIGVEGELYLDNFSIEAWAGVAGIDYDVLPDVAGVFVLADAAYYFTDDFRASVGYSHLLGVNGLHLGAEYQLTNWDLPLSVTADARFNTDGSYSVMGGIKGYFGGEQKSLKDRHRQDDPPNRVLSLFMASGSLLYQVASGGVCTPTTQFFASDGNYQYYQILGECQPSDPEEFCTTPPNNFDGAIDGECVYYIGD